MTIRCTEPNRRGCDLIRSEGKGCGKCDRRHHWPRQNRSVVIADVPWQARKRARLKQAALAKRLGRPQSFIAKVESGERRVDVAEFISIVRAVGADPVRVFSAV